MIEVTTCKAIYTADGAQVYWSVPFAYNSTSEVKLYVHDGTALTEVPSSNYNFDTANNRIQYPVITTLNPVPPVTAGYKVMVLRTTNNTQEKSSLTTYFKSNDIERIADKLTMIAQEFAEQIGRCVKYDPIAASNAITDATQYLASLTASLSTMASVAVDNHNASSEAHQSLLAGKQDTIEDLSTIRTGAALGATAIQSADLTTALATKQNTLTAGNNITISGDTISAVAANYTAGNNIIISNGQISAIDTKYTAGSNVSISAGNVISATDTKYTAGDNITISDQNVISASTSSATAAWGSITGTLTDQTDLKNALDAKQDTLVAGDNIIINGNTISSTGGGSASLNWGNIAGTLSNQTDLQTALDAKQSSLSTAQLNAANSGVTSSKVSGYDTHVANSDIHVTAEQKTAWSAKQDAISSSNKLSASLIATDSDAQFVSASDKSTWTAKQDAISDLSTIRSGASAGATAVQPNALSTVATTGSYTDLSNQPTIPTVYNSTITITQGGTTKGTFTLNQSGATTIDVDAAGSSITVDDSLSSSSTNPVQNRVINSALNSKQDTVSDLSTIRSNASSGAGAASTIATYGDIVTHNASEFLTSVPAASSSTLGGVKLSYNSSTETLTISVS